MPSQTSTSVCDAPKVVTLLDWYCPTALQELADVHDTAPPDLTGRGIQIVEGDLSTMNVKPSYDGHYTDLLTLLKLRGCPVVLNCRLSRGELRRQRAASVLGRAGTMVR
jgi:hypothetical protein